MRIRAGWLTLGLVLWAGTPSFAYYLDSGRNFDVRARVYSQLGIMMEDAQKDQPTRYKIGNLAQHRNFWNPEFDAKLTDYTGWMKETPGLSLISPDDFKFRFAWWGFYDGIYDYMDDKWADAISKYKARFSESDNPKRESFVFNDQYKNPRHIYASRNRINELYLDYTKGPVFIRAGRQAISWGESDDISLLDANNPFDLTLGAPGFFQDPDEARIPLWTLRGTVKLAERAGPFSSLFADMYIVPGIIDTTVLIDPITAGVSPFNPDQGDPQDQIDAQGVGKVLHLNLVSKQPSNDWSNTRWGFRLAGVLLRDYTVQGWFYRTFNNAPVPLLVSPGGLALAGPGGVKPTPIDLRGRRVGTCQGATVVGQTGVDPVTGRACTLSLPVVTILERRLESVFGLAASWYSQPVNGVIRTELELFKGELGFIPDKNLNPFGQFNKTYPDGRSTVNTIPKANILRWVVGYDRFFFARLLNPTNSFVLVTALHGQWNTSERTGANYRYYGAGKPGKSQQEPGFIAGVPSCQKPGPDGKFPITCPTAPTKNFEDLYRFDNLFLQIALQTDYMHGRLQPRIVAILDATGIFAFAPSLTYRFTDNILGSATFLGISASRRAGLATFRGHDMLQVRMTYQLN